MQPAGQRIRRAAVELFAERGFHGTGIRDLAERAGLSSATLYHYMGTQEDLLVEIMRESLQRLLVAARQIDTGSLGTGSALGRAAEGHLTGVGRSTVDRAGVDPAGVDRAGMDAAEIGRAEVGAAGGGPVDVGPVDVAWPTAGPVVALGGGPAERLAGLVHVHVLTHATRQRETRVVDDEMRALSDGPRAAIVALRDEYEQIWQRVIEVGARDGVFRVEAPQLARLALLEMCSGVARWYQPAGPIARDELALRYGGMALGLLGAAVPSDQEARVQVAASQILVEENWPAGVS